METNPSHGVDITARTTIDASAPTAFDGLGGRPLPQ